ncbi:nucleotidyltransferase domain-containing protein [Pullulanibacillus sp. KACC 23026]|uniref:nucleotidyltransferase domain-containing protein n=1 Tax=Pullulanibacillus sp. KACC 23026 TaxID=3028315 RepID=UPI0023AFD4A6|nr:nucleotidyltransferase domain-containing protein [Pullulanibacillus sp. KACC 23026]WEG14393.1 nucleotidyltransferase domain-containing protein [Pullulanibacillus sp. KACC 23026]
MGCNWETCPREVHEYSFKLLTELKYLLKNKLVGLYIHGSLALGGFNPAGSDVDVLVVTSGRLTLPLKRSLAKCCLSLSNLFSLFYEIQGARARVLKSESQLEGNS